MIAEDPVGFVFVTLAFSDMAWYTEAATCKINAGALIYPGFPRGRDGLPVGHLAARQSAIAIPPARRRA